MAKVGSHTLNVATEGTFGTAPASGFRSFECTDENLVLKIDRIESKGLRANRRVLSSTSGWAAGNKSVEGDLSLEVPSAGFGRWLAPMLGTVAAPTSSGTGTATVYTHKATVGALDGKSLTIQAIRTDIGGVEKASNYLGCKIPAWELTAETGSFVKMKFTIDGRDETYDATAATTAYVASQPLVYTGASIYLDGSSTALPCKSFGLKADSGMVQDRYVLGSSLKREQVEADLRSFEGSISVDWDSAAGLYSKFTSGTIASVIARFQGPTIGTSTTPAELKVTLPAIRFDGTTANGGGEIIETELPFVVLDSSATDGPVTIEYISGDATP